MTVRSLNVKNTKKPGFFCLMQCAYTEKQSNTEKK